MNLDRWERKVFWLLVASPLVMAVLWLLGQLLPPADLAPPRLHPVHDGQQNPDREK